MSLLHMEIEYKWSKKMSGIQIFNGLHSNYHQNGEHDWPALQGFPAHYTHHSNKAMNGF